MRALLFFVLILGLVAGCRKSGTAGPAQTASQNSSALAARLQAAKAITFTNERDAALGAVARDAAALGDGEITKAAIAGMTFVNEKDKAASDSALKLAAANQHAAATEVAKMITFTNLRDITLKKLATGNL
jgi:hypothetical protein